MHEWMERIEKAHGWKNGMIGRWMDGWIDGWMDGWMNGIMNKETRFEKERYLINFQ